MLLVAAYWRTNLTMRQIGPLFGVSHSAAHGVIDTVGPLLALAPVRRTNSDIGAALTVRPPVAGATEPPPSCTRAW